MQTGAALCALLLIGALALAPAPAAGWRLLAALGAARLASHPLLTIVYQRGAAAVRRFEWDADGCWFIWIASGIRVPATLDPATAAMGPWILLVWRTVPGRIRDRRYALIDAAGVSPSRFRALRGRLNLTAKRANAAAAR